MNKSVVNNIMKNSDNGNIIKKEIDNMKDEKIVKLIKYGDLKEWEPCEGLVMGYEKVDGKYTIENDIPMAEKIDIINTLVDLPISYLLNLISKFVVDYESGLIKDAPPASYQKLNTNSLRAWIKKNDKEGVLEYSGRIDYIEVKTNITNFLTPMKLTGYVSDLESLVNAAFHNLLDSLREEEEKIYWEMDEENIYIGEVCDLICKYDKWSRLLGNSFSIEAKKDCNSMKNTIFIVDRGHNYTKRALSIEEIESLEKCLNAIEKDYQQSLDRIQKLEEELHKEERKKDDLLDNAIEKYIKCIEVNKL